MPIYEYQCLKCGSITEALQKIGSGTEGITCRVCGGQELKKIFSTHSIGKSKAKVATGTNCSSGSCCSGGSCGL